MWTHVDRHHRRLLASLAIAAAFVVASWDRLALPFSTDEAIFIHQALVSGKQVVSPAFEGPQNEAATAVMEAIGQLVGFRERPLRLACVLALLLAAAALAEVLADAGAWAGLVPLAALLALPPFARVLPLRPEVFVLLPAALAMLAVPAARPIGIPRSLLAIAGVLGVAAFGLVPAAVVAAALFLSALGRAEVLDRILVVVTASAGVIAAWAFQEVPHWSVIPALDRDIAIHAAAPAAALLAGFGVRRVGRAGPALATCGLLALCAVQWASSRAGPSTTPVATLDRVRMVALPGTALATHGSDRARIAVYARLGHAPGTPIIYLPEHGPLETLAALCRDNGISELWVHPPIDAVPPGFSAPESRRVEVDGAMPLHVEAP